MSVILKVYHNEDVINSGSSSIADFALQLKNKMLYLSRHLLKDSSYILLVIDQAYFFEKKNAI
jgi:hypothetical protein